MFIIVIEEPNNDFKKMTTRQTANERNGHYLEKKK